MLTIGCHLSSSKGYLAMGKEAVSIGANTFQFFTRNPRGGAAKPFDERDAQAYMEFAKEHNTTLTIMEQGEHWFHTEEQMTFLDNWIRTNL